MGISAVIIVHNEERNIAGCLASIDFADEIVVVDSGSTDGTEAICRAHPKVRFHTNPWEGFGPQKNRAVDLACHEWIFSIDADERVSPELATEVARVAAQADCDGYLVRRRNFYRGQWVRHSGWWPDEVLRLFRKEKGRFNNRLVHEAVEVQGAIGTLEGCIDHSSFRSASDFLAKAQSYSSIGADQLMAAGRRTTPGMALGRSLFAFIKAYVLRAGFLDGRVGLLIAYSNAVGVFYRYMKRLEMDDPDA